MTEQPSNDVNEIIAGLPMASLADQLGVDSATAESAVRQALPALLGGMQANAADPAGAASLSGAIEQHSPALIEGGVDLNQVDTNEGEKIVGHVFGANAGGVAQTLGGNLGGGVGGAGGADLIQKLLPILAPIVLSYLAQRMRGGSGQTGGIEDLLGSVLGGLGGGGVGGGQSGGSVLDMLGGLLGGGRR